MAVGTPFMIVAAFSSIPNSRNWSSCRARGSRSVV